MTGLIPQHLYDEKCQEAETYRRALATVTDDRDRWQNEARRLRQIVGEECDEPITAPEVCALLGITPATLAVYRFTRYKDSETPCPKPYKQFPVTWRRGEWVEWAEKTGRKVRE